MPIKEAPFKSALTGEVSSFLEKKRLERGGKSNEGDVDFLSVIDFIDRFKLLPFGLYPVQRFIVKMYYNIPLDNTVKSIPIRNMFGDQILHEFTEVDYLKYLYDTGRCNIREQDGRERRELVLVLGRRSGKSALSAIFAAYEIYKLLRRGNPQAYYGMPGGSEIRVLCVANDKEQASIVFDDMRGHVEQVDYFKTALSNVTQTFMKFRTESDRKKFGDVGKSTIAASFKSSIAKGLRGRGVMCCILDEIAFFVDDGKCQNVSGRVLTSRGLLSLDSILTEAGVDRSTVGWTDIDPLNVVQEGGRSAIATRVYYGGVQSTRLIVTKSGYSIEPTGDHRVKVMSGSGDIEWKYVSDIVPGDYIGIARGTNMWPDRVYDCSSLIPEQECSGRLQCRIPVIVNEELGEFLGILVGDGVFWSEKCQDHIQVKGGCEELLPVVRSHFSGHFDRFEVSRLRTKARTTNGVFPWVVETASAPFSKFLDNLGLRIDTNPLKRSVPWVIFSSPKSVVARFLRGLFETDGGVGRSSVFFTTMSRQLADDVQSLLLNFGVISKVTTRWNRVHNKPYIRLQVIDQESRRSFHREIGFITESKNTRLVRGLDDGGDLSDIVPHQSDRIRRIIATTSRSASISKDSDLRFSTILLYPDLSKRLNASYQSVRKLVKILDGNSVSGTDVQALRKICETNYYWDPVFSIEETKSETADLFVPDGNEYVAQGMTNHNSSAERVYKAIMPSLGQFSPRDPKDKLKSIGPTEGRMILISSPDAKEGFFYRLYQMAMSNSKGSSDMLVIQAPTWEVNPTLDRSYYEKEYYKDPKSFMTEHGAEFSDRVRGWIEDARDLQECIVKDLRPKDRGFPRDPHFAGIDVGLVNDGTCISLTRINDGKIELVYHEAWYARKKWKEVNPHLTSPPTPYAMTLQDQARLDMNEIAKWFKALSQRFFIAKGVFDQWSGIVFEQELHKAGLRQFETRNFFSSDSAQVYQTLKMFMYNRQLSLYDYPLPDLEDSTISVRHSPLIQELLELQATSGGKNIVVVEAPNIPGKHDDVADSLARSVFLASEYIRDNPGILERASAIEAVRPNGAVPIGYHQYHRSRNRMHGGTSVLRTAPRFKR